MEFPVLCRLPFPSASVFSFHQARRFHEHDTMRFHGGESPSPRLNQNKKIDSAAGRHKGFPPALAGSKFSLPVRHGGNPDIGYRFLTHHGCRYPSTHVRCGSRCRPFLQGCAGPPLSVPPAGGPEADQNPSAFPDQLLPPQRGWGARLARGCTSGQALSGGAILAEGSRAFMMALFLGGFATAYFIRGVWK